MTNPVHLVINGQPVRAESDWSVLEAAKHNGVKIPHFCYLEGVHQIGSCRVGSNRLLKGGAVGHDDYVGIFLPNRLQKFRRR